MDIFVSYASADREHAARLAGTLTRAGYEVWWDRTIPPGRVFDEVIQEAIVAARCMLVLWSRESVKSNWVKTEAAEGAARGMLVPVLIEDVAPPIEFKRIQAANLTRWEGNTDDAQYRQLKDAIARLLTGAAGSSPPPAQRLDEARPDGVLRLVKAFGFGAVTAAAAIAALWIALKPATDPGPTPAPRAIDETPLAVTRALRPEPAATTSSTSPAPDLAPGRIDLLAAEAGGHLVVASSEGWSKMIDGEVDTYGWADSGIGVFAFKDEQPARFDTIALFIPGAAGANVREFEIFAGSDTPTGSFRSLGRYSTQNLRVMSDPWQRFSFTPVTAKYLKLQGLVSHDGSAVMYIHELRLYGELTATSGSKD